MKIMRRSIRLYHATDEQAAELGRWCNVNIPEAGLRAECYYGDTGWEYTDELFIETWSDEDHALFVCKWLGIFEEKAPGIWFAK